MEYDKDTNTPVPLILEIKILIHNVISDAKYGARFMRAGLAYFFLATPMLHPEYMKNQNSNIPYDNPVHTLVPHSYHLILHIVKLLAH